MELCDDQIHFWFTRLGQNDPRISTLHSFLSVDEIKRAERFHFDRDRVSYTISHGVLRQLIAQYVGVAPRDVEYVNGPHGKPSLAPVCGDTSLQFNMSHTAGLAVYAFGRNRRIGVDVEHIDREIKDRDAIAEGYFSKQEVEVYRALPEIDKVTGFFNCWTRKESYLKARGDGLSTSLDSFQVTLRPGDPARLVFAKQDRATAWSMASLEPAEGYVTAISAESNWNLIDLGEFHSELDFSRT